MGKAASLDGLTVAQLRRLQRRCERFAGWLEDMDVQLTVIEVQVAAALADAERPKLRLVQKPVA